MSTERDTLARLLREWATTLDPDVPEVFEGDEGWATGLAEWLDARGVRVSASRGEPSEAARSKSELKRRVIQGDPVARLARIAAIIEAVDNRCMATDGPVTPTLNEMTQAEISEIHELASVRLVTKFADDMGRELEANEHKTGWWNLSPARCLLRAEQEMGELRRAMDRGADFETIRSEAADVGNFLAMLVWNLCEETRDKAAQPREEGK